MSEMNERGMYRAYGVWNGMKTRCTNPRSAAYKNYGARGIRVCERWLASFDDFLADMGIPPEKHSLDRIDVNGNYEPENCRWATAKVQMNNTRRQLPEYSDNNALRAWMVEQGMGCTDLAERLGVDRTLVWMYASGKRKVTDGFRWRFGSAFGMNIAVAVLGWSESEPEQVQA